MITIIYNYIIILFAPRLDSGLWQFNLTHVGLFFSLRVVD